MKASHIHRIFTLGWSITRHLPAPVGYTLADIVGTGIWVVDTLTRNRRRSTQLRANLRRVIPEPLSPAQERALTRAGMRSYMRYFYETLALPGLSPEQINARVRAQIDPQLHEDLRHSTVCLALGHMGNWDLIGAWACMNIGQVLTVGEKLNPPELFDQFVAFRESLGMRIIGQARGERVFEPLMQAAQEKHYLLCLLADRDLSSHGILTQLCGHAARVAAGPAAAAVRLNAPLYVASVSYEELDASRAAAAGGHWGIVLTVTRVARPDGPGGAQLEGRELVTAWTHAWARDFGEFVSQAPQDWHMLQPLFDSDLDHERLARGHERERAAHNSSTQAEQAGTQHAEAADVVDVQHDNRAPRLPGKE